MREVVRRGRLRREDAGQQQLADETGEGTGAQPRGESFAMA